jgi:competence protein ComEA
MKRQSVIATALALLLSAGLSMAATKAAPTGKINVNSATVEQFESLPGVGPKLAARIVEYRQKAGGSFKTTQELINVKGIGEKNFARIESYLTLGEGGSRSGSTK